jgi:hypothetical protein
MNDLVDAAFLIHGRAAIHRNRPVGAIHSVAVGTAVKAHSIRGHPDAAPGFGARCKSPANTGNISLRSVGGRSTFRTACRTVKVSRTRGFSIDMHSSQVLFPRALRFPRPWLPLVLSVLATATPVRSQSQSEPRPQPPIQSQAVPDSPWKVSGFGTVGLVGQSGGNGWGFARNTTQRGADTRISATPDTRLGLQLNWNPGTRWEAGIQGVLQSKPAGAPLAENIDWAYLGYRLQPDTRLRIGRVNPDIFLFADSRNVGFALPWARPPVDFYGFAPLVSIDGADLEQRWFAGDSTWRARASGGSVRTGVTTTDGRRLQVQGRNTWALGLSREQGGLLLKASYLRSQFQIDTGNGADQLRDGLGQLRALPVPGLAGTLDRLEQNVWTGGLASYWALAAQYDTGPWTFIAEGSQLRVPRSPLNGKRAYASAGYRRGSITYYGVLGRVRPDQEMLVEPDLVGPLAPFLGPAGARQAQVLAGYATGAGLNYRFDQSTVGAGLRWDFRPDAALKLQVDRFNVRPFGGASWRSSDAQGTRGTLVSVLVDFVWGQ